MKVEWMKKLHGVLQDTKWMMFYGLPYIASGPLERGGSHTKFGVVVNNQMVIGS